MVQTAIRTHSWQKKKPQHPKALDISGPYNLQEIILVKQENKEKMLLGFFALGREEEGHLIRLQRLIER